jgi:hypothetical protein
MKIRFRIKIITDLIKEIKLNKKRISKLKLPKN